MARFDLHIHSRFSFDGFMSPKTIIKMARRRCLAGIAITDHGTIKGGLNALSENKDNDFLVIVGTEIHSTIGDIIGLFLKEEITCREPEEVVQNIHRQGGLAILPHPYHHHHLPLPENFLASLDAVEVRNGRVKDYADQAWREMVAACHLAAVAGSDAHLPWEVGRVWTEIEGKIQNESDVKEAVLRRGCRPAGYASSPPGLAVLLSKVMKRCRTMRKA